MRVLVNCSPSCASGKAVYPTIGGTGVQPAALSDVNINHPFRTSILWASDQGITQGTGDGRFLPANSLRRGDMAAFLYRMEGEPAGNYPNPGFTDVPLDSLFYGPVAWMANAGITTGYSDNTFRPDSRVTRGEMAAFLHRLAGAPGGPFPNPGFTDVPPSHPFFTAISWMKAQGITSGYPDGTFRPTASVARGEMAAFLYRFEN